MYRKIFLIFILSILSIQVNGQVGAKSKVTPLKIGDTIPDMVISGFLGNADRHEKMADLYEPGLLIINFWATWCVPCIRSIPRLDSLQAQFKGNFNMVCITYQNAKMVSLFFNQYPKLKPQYLSVVTDDSLLIPLFPHRIIPHNIWIDRHGVIRAITGDDEITKQNITDFVNGKSPKLSIKADDMDFDFGKPLDVKNNNFIYRSIITKYRKDIGNGGTITVWNQDHTLIKRYLGWNETIIDFLWKAYRPNSSIVNYKEIELHTKDSAKFIWPEFIKNIYGRTKYKNREEWLDENVFCYELSIRRGEKDSIFYRNIVRDICRYFNLSISVEKRRILCWVITRKPGVNILKNFKRSKYSKPSIPFTGNGADSGKLVVRDKTIYEILDHCININSFDPYVNKTGIDYPIDVTMQFTHLKRGTLPIGILRKKMEEYGLVFKKEIYPYPVLVIRDNSPGS